MLTPKVDRPACLSLLMAALATGCVLPIGPQFDPPEKNYPPYVESSSPGVGEIFTLGMTGERTITVTLSDQNLNDHLYIRWLVDYPGTETNPALLVHQVQTPASVTAERSPVHIQPPPCAELHLASGPHRFVMSVADRPYKDLVAGEAVDPDAPLDSVDVQQANRIRLVWILYCP